MLVCLLAFIFHIRQSIRSWCFARKGCLNDTIPWAFSGLLNLSLIPLYLVRQAWIGLDRSLSFSKPGSMLCVCLLIGSTERLACLHACLVDRLIDNVSYRVYTFVHYWLHVQMTL